MALSRLSPLEVISVRRSNARLPAPSKNIGPTDNCVRQRTCKCSTWHRARAVCDAFVLGVWSIGPRKCIRCKWSATYLPAVTFWHQKRNSLSCTGFIGRGHFRPTSFVQQSFTPGALTGFRKFYNDDTSALFSDASHRRKVFHGASSFQFISHCLELLR